MKRCRKIAFGISETCDASKCCCIIVSFVLPFGLGLCLVFGYKCTCFVLIFGLAFFVSPWPWL